MEYKRLTERVGKGVAVRGTSSNDNRSIWNAIERLAELEDKIENGTLIELPCKVGDTVYYIGSLEARAFFKIKTIHDIVTMPFSLDMLDSYKIVWFLTKAEAEQKLKEVQNAKRK
jgi:hypothetical protein